MSTHGSSVAEARAVTFTAIMGQHLSGQIASWHKTPPNCATHSLNSSWHRMALNGTSLRQPLRIKVEFGKQTMFFHPLNTLLTRIEACLNSRPLTARQHRRPAHVDTSRFSHRSTVDCRSRGSDSGRADESTEILATAAPDASAFLEGMAGRLFGIAAATQQMASRGNQFAIE